MKSGKRFFGMVTILLVLVIGCLAGGHTILAKEGEPAGESEPAGEGVPAGDGEVTAQSLGVLKVGYVTDRNPVSYRDEETGELGGISREIFDRIQELSGLQFEYVELPSGSVTYSYLWEQGFDLVTSVEYNKANLNAKGILMSEPYIRGKKVIVGRSDLLFDRNANLTVAVSTGSQTLKKVLQAQYPNFQLKDYDTLEDCFEALRHREADLLILNQYVVEYLLSRPRYEDLQVIPLEGFDEELCFSAVIPLENDGEVSDMEAWQRGEVIISALNDAISKMTEEETTNIVVKVTMEKRYRYRLSDFLYRYRYSLVMLVILFIVLAVLMVVSLRFYLRTTKSRAEAQARSTFLSTMSHEIRTPLNGLIGLNYLMLQNMGNPEKMSHYLQQSTTTARYLLSLVNDILDMSKLNENKMDLEEKPFSLRMVVSTVEALMRTRMEEKGLDFSVEADIPYPRLIGDETRLEQVFMNVVDNAYKFTPKGGKITVRIQQEMEDGGKVTTRVWVIDTGCGMSEEFRKKIFDSFTQERNTVSKGNQGTGLGMAISYLVIKQMGGEMQVESAPGQGSTFSFAFPAKTTTDFVEEIESSLPQLKEGQGAKHILVAEDNELNAEILVELLEEEGFEVSLAEDGRRAVELFEASDPGSIHVILMDLLMPVMNGYEAAVEIRKMPRADAKTVKIFACTANTFKEDRDMAFASGMDDFISKPVDVEKLFQKLKEC